MFRENLNMKESSMLHENLNMICLDCNVDTEKINEFYMVHDYLWNQAVPDQYERENRVLCIGCLEERLGRVLTAADFTNFPVNKKDIQSYRLISRIKNIGCKTRILGNGDALSLEDARLKAEISGADGVMLGRAIFGNPWLFHPDLNPNNIPLSERLRVMVEHTELFVQLLPFKNLAVMKKHYKAYVKDFAGASELRAVLMEQDSVSAIKTVVEKFIRENPSA